KCSAGGWSACSARTCRQSVSASRSCPRRRWVAADCSSASGSTPEVYSAVKLDARACQTNRRGVHLFAGSWYNIRPVVLERRKIMNRVVRLAVAVFASGVGVASVARGQSKLPADFSVALPEIPKHTVSILDFGGVGDGKTSNTGAFGK